ncbi:hypothetical protein Tco_0718906 [Tanacetum coccineum]
MQISAFMRHSKCPELARRFVDRVPQTVTEMMKRVDDFVKSEEAYKSTKLPKGEHLERGHETPYKGSCPPRIMQGRRYDNKRFKNRRHEVNQLSLEALVKRPKEILATELQLQLPPCPPMIEMPKKENLDRYYDYHREKGHYTNDCYQLKRQLEVALESGKLNHLVKDVRQRGSNRGRKSGNNSTNRKVINMVYVRGECQKRKFQKRKEEDWMNAPITFPSILSDDVSDEPLIIEAEFEGYLVRRVFVDQGAIVQLLLLEKIELKVMFGSERLCRRTMIKFTVVQASSPYNIILGRTGMRELRTISSTTHAMMKFLTSRRIAMLVPRTAAIFECQQLEGKQILPEEQPDEGMTENGKNFAEEDVMINPAFMDQRITIET